MSRWTTFRDDVKNLAKDHPKKTAVIFAIGFALGAIFL